MKSDNHFKMFSIYFIAYFIELKMHNCVVDTDTHCTYFLCAERWERGIVSNFYQTNR